MPIHKDYRPDRDATVVTRSREAGAVFLGKLQLTEGVFGAHHPAIDPVNLWGAAHWTGVSSSGPGVATAVGFATASLGCDTGGSIRFHIQCAPSAEGLGRVWHPKEIVRVPWSVIHGRFTPVFVGCACGLIGRSN